MSAVAPSHAPDDQLVTERPTLLAERGCPFAHRVIALLTHLGVDYDSVECTVGQRPNGLAQFSSSGRVPFFVHGGVAFGESRVMLEHIAELHSFEDAYPKRALDRALQREVMVLVDEAIATRLLRETPLRAARLAEYVDRLEHVARITPAAPSLIAFHIAPIWLRLQWFRPKGEITRAIQARPALVAWLDALTRIEAIVTTTPSRADNLEDFERVIRSLAACGT